MASSVTEAIESSPGVKANIAGYLVFALLMLLAAAYFLTTEWQLQIGRVLITSAKQAIMEGGAKGFAEAALLAGAIAIWYTLKGLIIFLAFLLTELKFAGLPKKWNTLGFALMLRVLSILIIVPILNRIIPTAVFQPLLLLENSHLPSPLLPFANVVLGIGALLVADLVVYLIHRLEHAIPLLWRFHSVHHSIEDLNAINSYSHPVDVIVERLAIIVFATLIGFKADMIIILVAFQIIHDRLVHTSAPINLGKLNVVLADNRTHHLHHSLHPDHYDKNFGSIFTFWDRLLGTYVRPHPTKLAITGLADKLPPTTLAQYFLATLKSRAVEASAIRG